MNKEYKNKTVSWEYAQTVIANSDGVIVKSGLNMIIFPLFNKYTIFLDLLTGDSFEFNKDENQTVKVTEDGNLLFISTDNEPIEVQSLIASPIFE